MFNVGGGEIIVILLIALIVLGPDKLPSAARQAGKYLNEFRRMSSGFQSEIRSAMDVLPDTKPSGTPGPAAGSTPTDASTPTPGSGGTSATPDSATGPADPTPT